MTSSCIIPSFRLLRSQSSLVFNSLHLWFTTVDAQPLLIKGQEQSYIPCPDPQFSPCYLHTKNSFQKPPQLGSIILPWFQIFTSSLLTVDTKLCNSFLSTYHWLSMHFPNLHARRGSLILCHQHSGLRVGDLEIELAEVCTLESLPLS